jgi:hypothetical protein
MGDLTLRPGARAGINGRGGLVGCCESLDLFGGGIFEAFIVREEIRVRRRNQRPARAT